MGNTKLWVWTKVVLALAVCIGGGVSTVYATTSTSENYEVSETEFGAGSTLESCSGQYCTEASIGDMTTDRSSSANHSASFGSLESQEEPLLEVIVEPGQSDLGILSTDKPSTKTMTVRIRSYMTSGYTLQIVGDPPKYGGHTLAAPSAPTASTPGSEQFALNLVANTSPSVGLDPAQIPSGEFSFGTVEDDYNAPDLFKYTSGEIIARSISETGRTDYTISMIINVSNSTPGGHYASDFAAVVVPIY